MKTYMDPLYANYDKRKKTLDENSAPVPQPTPNSMPVFGAAAAPAMNQTPVAEPASVDEPTPAPAPAVEPVAEPAPVANLVAEPDPTIESTPVQDPFAPKPQSNDFQQEFEQLVDGTKPTQLSEPQPQFNPNYTGTGDIVLNLDQPKKKFNTKIIAIIVGIVVVTVLAVVLIAMGGGKKGGVAKGNKQDVASFVEYFVFGTEGENEVTDEIMSGDPEDFEFHRKLNSSDYDENLKYENGLIGKDIKNEALISKINVYGEASRDLYTDFLVKKYIDDAKEEDAKTNTEFASLLESKKEYEEFMINFYAQVEDNCDLTGIDILECYNDDFVSDNIELVKEENKISRKLRSEKEELYFEIVKDIQQMWRENK